MRSVRRLAPVAVLLAGLLPRPAAAAPAPPPSTACPASGGAGSIAGYTLSAAASGVHAALNSPGLLPVGDPEVGTIIGLDLPLGRVNASSGVINALASPAYPGDTAAHLGTAVATFAPSAPPIPNYPVVAESDFPPAPGKGALATFGPAGLPVAVAAGQATSSEKGGATAAHIVSTDLGGAFTTGADDAATGVDVKDACVDASARATTSGIVVAGIVDIAGVTGYAAAKSDGKTATPQALLQIGKVTVAGLAAYIDRDGVHVASQGVAAGVVATVEHSLQQTLAASGTTIKLVNPSVTRNGGAATADSGMIEVTTKQILPAIGHPPQGTPPLPLVVEVSYGHVSVSVNATSVPAPTATGGGAEVSPPAGAVSGADAQPGTGAAPTVTSTGGSVAIPPPVATPGTESLAANSVPPAPGRGEPVPIGWMLIGIALSVVAIGPLLGYARWQLLEGRV